MCHSARRLEDPTPSGIREYAKTKKWSSQKQVQKEGIPLRAVSMYKMHVPELLPESQLPANHCSISVCPAVITDAAPLPIQEDLDPSFLSAFSIHQPHGRPCRRKHMGRCKQNHQSARCPDLGFFRIRWIPDISKLKIKKKKKRKKECFYMKTFDLCARLEDYTHSCLIHTENH